MILLNPGPVNVSERVRQALLKPDICHRESEFNDLVEGIQDKLVRAFAPAGGYLPILITGSGTAAVEAAVTSCLPPGRRILVIKNGVYSQRIATIAASHKMQNMDIAGEWDQRFDTETVPVALRQNKAIEVVAVVHHETATGLINPVKEIGAIAKKAGRVLLVDGVSSLAGEELDFVSANVGLIVGSSGKCIQGFPGVGFVMVRRDIMEQMVTYEQRSVYFHLPTYYKHLEEGSVPFTPAVQLYYAFNEALSELLEEGVPNRIARYRKAARLIRNRMRAIRVKFFLREPLWSNTLTAFTLPDGVHYDHLHDLLKARGYIIYAGQAQLAEKLFRVANMGALTEANLTGFLDAFEEALPEAVKLGEARSGEMGRLADERVEKAEREAAEAKAAEEVAKAEEEARKAEEAARKAEAEAPKGDAEDAKTEDKPEVKSGA
jgi:2-aminoethylphosphonate-pyruvate transaminase